MKVLMGASRKHEHGHSKLFGHVYLSWLRQQCTMYLNVEVMFLFDAGGRGDGSTVRNNSMRLLTLLALVLTCTVGVGTVRFTAEPDPDPENLVQYERVQTLEPARHHRTTDNKLFNNQKTPVKSANSFLTYKEQRRKTDEESKESEESVNGLGRSRYLESPVDYETQARYYGGEWEPWDKRRPVPAPVLSQEMMLMEVLGEKVRANKTAEDYRGFHNNLMEMLGKSKLHFYPYDTTGLGDLDT